MMGKTRFLILAVLCFVVLTGVSCGKSDGPSDEPKAKADRPTKQQTGKTETPLTQIAQEALDDASIDDEFAAGRQAVEAAGYVVKEYRSFPSQEITKRGRVLVYTDKKGKDSGGVVYLKKTGFQVAPAWHWYFKDMVPDSVINVEINRDGLWDLRFVSTKGRTEQFIQEETFTLSARERTDWIAMNGACSAPLTHDAAMWKCFDGDTTTAWRSSLAGPAFIEFDVPFGVADGNLTICTTASGQPRGCAVYADGKRVEEIELKPEAGRQVIALGQAVRGAKRIRLEFTSAHANAADVAIAELGLN
jgi:hypothetical protein